MITGTYNLIVDPSWRNVQQSEVFLECDTTLAPVTINLFEIADLQRFWNVKIVISDVNNNAGTNNITINSNVADAIDEDGNNQIVLNTNGESVILQVVSENAWLAVNSLESTPAPLPTIPIIVSGLNQNDLTNPIYTSLPVGSVLAVQNYAQMGAGCTLFKTTISNEDYQDWVVTATTNVGVTANIGFNPIYTSPS